MSDQKDDDGARVYDRSFSGFPGGLREWAGLVVRPSLATAVARPGREGPPGYWWARGRRDQGALRRALSAPLVWLLATSAIAGSGALAVHPSVLGPLAREAGPAVALSYALAGALAVLAALNAAELVARRPFAGPGGQAPLLLASLGPLPAAVAAASLALQHVVAAAALARAVVPGIGRTMLALEGGGGGWRGWWGSQPLTASAAYAPGGSPAARPLATAGAPSVFATAAPPAALGPLQAGALALDPLATALALLASLAVGLSARGVGWFCACATGAQLLASAAALGALFARVADGDGAKTARGWAGYEHRWLPASFGGSPAAALLGPVASAAGALFVAVFPGVSLGPTLADDARRPAQSLPAGTVAAAATTASLYAVTALAFVLGAGAAAGESSSSIVPPAGAAATAGATATKEDAAFVLAPFFLGLAAILGAFSGVPALVLGASRVVCGAARHRLLPAAGLGRVAAGRRLRSPAAATAVVAAAVVPLALLAPDATQALGGLAAVGFLVTQAMVAVAVLLERASDARGADAAEGGQLATEAADAPAAAAAAEEEEEEEEDGDDHDSVWRRQGRRQQQHHQQSPRRGRPPQSPAPPLPPLPPPSPPPLSAASSPDGRVSIRSPSPSDDSSSFDGCWDFYPDPVYWARQGPGAVWLPRALVGALVACSCGAGAALSAGAAWPGEALWPLVSVLGFWLVLTASLHVCNVAVATATAAAAAAVAPPPPPPPPVWLPPPPPPAPSLPTAAEEGPPAAFAARLLGGCCCGSGRRPCRRRTHAAPSPRKPPTSPLAPGAFRVPGGPWLPSLSLLGYGAAGGACLPPGALLRWLALAGAAAVLWALYGMPATDARATRWAAEDAAEEERRAAEAEEEGRGRQEGAAVAVGA